MSSGAAVCDFSGGITLATLSKATAQQVFDQVASRGLRQGQQCVIGRDCAYRGPAGACFAGHLISDAEAGELGRNMRCSWRDLVDTVGMAPEEHLELISALQRVHDRNFDGPGWRSRVAAELLYIAIEYDLSPAIIDATLSEIAAQEAAQDV